MREVRGTFFRAVDAAHRDRALRGSRAAGRYSRPHEPTLYLSSSVEGVAAAMVAHRDARAAQLEIVEVDVVAAGIVDLRDPDALERLDVSMVDAVAPWQDVVASGGEPPSWRVRDALVAAGATGLIDPSRQRPGLWHLVLFRWNELGGATVRVVDG